jgi:DNA-binding response OmpR family regulator
MKAGTLKILFADDDLKYSLVIKRFLEHEGYEVTYAGNGRQALELFGSVKPDLVLLDINMPGLNGFEVAEYIRREDARTLIFFLSDRTDKSDRLKGFTLKGNDYIPKPFYPEELLARIRERLGSPATTADAIRISSTTFNYSTNELCTATGKTLITSRQADILRLLASSPNTAVGRESILNSVWGNVSYQNSLALNVQITYLRKALRNDGGLSIVSISGKGYMLRIEI